MLPLGRVLRVLALQFHGLAAAGEGAAAGSCLGPHLNAGVARSLFGQHIGHRGSLPLPVPARAEPTSEPADALGRSRARPQKGITVARASVQVRQGRPVLLVDGEPYPPLILCNHAEHPSRSLIDRPPVHLYTFLVSLAEVWQDTDAYDFAVADRQARAIGEGDPAALLFPRISLDAPQWWLERHPDEMNTYADAGTDTGALARFRRVYGVDSPSLAPTDGQSLASTRWRADTNRALAALIRHLRAGVCSERLIGCHLAAGGGGEWFTRGLFENRFADYSGPMRKAFRQWLRVRYHGDDEALRAAWQDPALDFDHAAIPLPERRSATDCFAFRDPRRSRDVIDYGACFSQVFAEGIAHFARTVKQTTQREWLCGVFYGYLFYGGMFPYTLQNSGHRALEKVLHCADVDLLAAPYSYNDRGLGGDSVPMSLVESVHLHGKLWFNEDDNRTFLAGAAAGHFGRTEDLQGTLAVLQRSVAHTLTKAAGLWWFDMTGGWYDRPEIARCMARAREIAELGDRLRRPPTPGPVQALAVVMDDQTPLCLSLGDALVRPFLTKQASCELGRIGAPYHTYLVDDLEDPRMPEYRCYLFLNTFCLTARQRRTIASRVSRDGKVAVWIYAPGFVQEDGLSVAAASELTGMQLGMAEVESDLHVHLVDFEHPVTRGLPRATRFGTDIRVGPVFYADDSSATTLGLLTYHYTVTRPGLCFKSFGDWTSVYIAAPMVPAGLLRNLARLAGVHVYSDSDDVLYADDRFLALHTRYAGPRRLCLPRVCDVHDLFAGDLGQGDPVASGVREFTVDLAAGVTRLYLLRDAS